MAGSDQVSTTGDGGVAKGLLGLLGLPADADHAAIQATHDELVAFLDSAPEALRPWAEQQVAAAKAALALVPPADEPVAAADEGGVDQTDFDDDAPILRRTVKPAKPVAPKPVKTAARPRKRSGLRALVVLGIIAAIVLAVYQMGGPAPATNAMPSDHPSVPTAEATPSVDEALAAQLKENIKKNPKDVDSLRALGQLYFSAGRYAEAATWQQKIVDLNPKDVDALLALGVAKFNSGDHEGAEKAWLKAVELDPKKAEIHYNLGFLYLAKSPPQIDKVEAEWNKVIELAPGTTLAETAKAHLARLAATKASAFPSTASPAAQPASSAPATPER